MAEGVGFEPTDRESGQQFSRLPRSTALPPLHKRILQRNIGIHCGWTLSHILVYRFWIDFQVWDDYTVNQLIILYLLLIILMYTNINQIKAFFPLQTWDNNKILRSKSEYVDIFDEEIEDFCDILIELMYEYDWVWLAAPQVGKNVRIIATTQRKEETKWKKSKKSIIWETAMVNPEILEHSDEMKKWEEACLSVPGLCWDVKRWTRIVLKYQDKKWKIHTKKYTWFSAVVIQHEIDHLDWILFTDKVEWKIREIDEKSDY